MHLRAPFPRERGFTFLELLVALSLFAAVSLFILQSFINGMAHAGRANERAAATTLALQVMEQIRASANPYTMVGFTDLARTPVTGLGSTPYAGVVNPTPHTFEIAVDVSHDAALTVTTVTVQVFRPADGGPYVTLTTVLDDL
jgi:prepilin-type N-terminal cleavage/methylation domain-containing protein